MKRGVLVTFVLAAFTFVLPAQHSITKFAVVDLPRVYEAFFNQSRAMQEFEQKGKKIQDEIDRRNLEIQKLKTEQAAAKAKGDNARAAQFEREINEKTRDAQQYYQAQIPLLREERRRLAQSDAFLRQVNAIIRAYAEQEGYSMVLNRQDERMGVIWYNPEVDITNKLIARLSALNK